MDNIGDLGRLKVMARKFGYDYVAELGIMVVIVLRRYK